MIDDALESDGDAVMEDVLQSQKVQEALLRPTTVDLFSKAQLARCNTDASEASEASQEPATVPMELTLEAPPTTKPVVATSVPPNAPATGNPVLAAPVTPGATVAANPVVSAPVTPSATVAVNPVVPAPVPSTGGCPCAFKCACKCARDNQRCSCPRPCKRPGFRASNRDHPATGPCACFGASWRPCEA